MAEVGALVGTWQMVSWTRRIVATGEVSDAMGPDPVGYIAYHADGRMMALVVTRARLRPSGPALSNVEKVALFDSMLAYTARYSLEGNTVTHHVDAAWNPAWEVDLVRPFALVGDTLHISNAPGCDPITGEQVTYELEFRKV